MADRSGAVALRAMTAGPCDTSPHRGRTTVATVNDSVVRTAGTPSRAWRMREWPNDDTVAHLIFVDHLVVPTSAEIAAAVEHAHRRGAQSIRTSALFPSAAAVLANAGFRTIDELALLRLRLDGDVIAALPPTRRRLRALHPWSHGQAADVDRDAFGSLWGNDAPSLRDICRATPLHRARAVREGRRLVGFAISGAAADNGYLQRLAVASDHRRRGLARDLVADSLRWMHSTARLHALVNTGVENEAALELYATFGFQRLRDVLTIAERRLDG